MPARYSPAKLFASRKPGLSLLFSQSLYFPSVHLKTFHSLPLPRTLSSMLCCLFHLISIVLALPLPFYLPWRLSPLDLGHPPCFRGRQLRAYVFPKGLQLQTFYYPYNPAAYDCNIGDISSACAATTCACQHTLSPRVNVTIIPASRKETGSISG